MTDDPQIEITLDRPNRLYQPDDELTVSYQVKGVDPTEIQAVEASILWYTEGTGEEDMSTHDFRRSLPIDEADRDLTRQKTFQSRLPRCPLSYDGVIVKVHWAVRVRVFLSRGRDMVEEKEFRIGNIEAARLYSDQLKELEQQEKEKNAQS